MCKKIQVRLSTAIAAGVRYVRQRAIWKLDEEGWRQNEPFELAFRIICT